MEKNVVVWHSVKDKLPSIKTRYAGPYGVEVLIFDEVEFKDAGFHPTSCSYHFDEKRFASPEDKKVFPDGWMPVSVTHWAEMPLVPVLPCLPDPSKYPKPRKKIR